MLRKYFKRYNLYELKASIACLVSKKTDCSQFPYYARHRELVKKRKRNVIASLIIAFLMCMAFAIWHADLHYTFFLSNYFGKVVVSFNQANLDPNSTLLRIDNKFQKVTFGKDKTYKKKMFLKKGFHEVSINSGSYKITRKITVLPYKQQQLSPTMRNGMEVPIRVYNLSPKEVMLSLRFWDALVPSKYLFQFDYYNELNEKLRKEKDNLIIWDSQRKKNVFARDYIMRSLQSNQFPYISNQDYAFIVSNFELNGVKYDNRRFKIAFGLDERTVVAHIPLAPVPASFKVFSSSGRLPLQVDGLNKGLVFNGEQYEGARFSHRRFRSGEKGAYYYEYLLPPGVKTIKIGNGPERKLNLKSGEQFNLKVHKEKGKFVY